MVQWYMEGDKRFGKIPLSSEVCSKLTHAKKNNEISILIETNDQVEKYDLEMMTCKVVGTDKPARILFVEGNTYLLFYRSPSIDKIVHLF